MLTIGKMLQKSDYMPHIDGLRAIAVLAVVLFHLEIDLIKSGYIGVDIFFVISGYLITNLIVKQNSDQSFKFSNFYMRRARRLFPALFVTCALTLAISFLLFSPVDYQNTGAQVLHSIFSISNFWFWNNSGYFASEAKLLPLLHTWSLSVEEQFYLVWPPLLVFLILRLKQKTALLALFLVFLTSLIAAIALYKESPDSVFFLMPFRIFEFVIGALLVWLPKKEVNKSAANAIVVISLIAIAYSLIAFSSETQINPTLLLIPCIASAAIIALGKTRTSRLLLSNRIMIGIGKISYSLYLIHWPIIVFFSYYDLNSLTNLEKLFVFALSIFLSILSYYFVEQPFRTSPKSKQSMSPAAFGLSCAALTALLAYPASSIWANDGYEWRTKSPRPHPTFVHEISAITTPEQKAMRAGKKFPKVVGYGSKEVDAKRAILIGDSHAGQYRDMIDYLGKKYNINFTLSMFPGCPPIFGTFKIYGVESAPKKQERCKLQIQHWQKLLKQERFDFVLLSSRWAWLYEDTKYGQYNYRRDYVVDINKPILDTKTSRKIFKQKLTETVKEIVSHGSRVIIFSQVPNAGKNISNCTHVPKYIFTRHAINERCVGVTKKEALDRLIFTNREIQKLSKFDRVTAVIPSNYFCQKHAEYCIVIRKNTLLYLDDDHINQYGSIYFAKRWENQKHFPFK